MLSNKYHIKIMINTNNMIDKIFIFTYYLNANYGEYKNYVIASDYKNACIKLFNYWISEEGFEYYNILSMLVNYFDITNNEVTTIINDNKHNTKQIINKFMEIYLPDINIDIIYDIVNYHNGPNNRMKKKHNEIHHHLIKIECDELSDYLIR